MDEDANFLDALPKRPLYLPFTWIVIGVVGTFVFLCVISLYFQIEIFQQKRQWASIEAKHQVESTLFQKKIQAFPNFAREMPLIQQLQASERELLAKKKIMGEFAHAMTRHRFSDDMRSLTHDLPSGLWLTKIKIDQDRNHLSFIGYALKPVLVSLFLQKLVSSANFKNIAFDLFTVKKETEGGIDYIKFEITNAGAEA